MREKPKEEILNAFLFIPAEFGRYTHDPQYCKADSAFAPPTWENVNSMKTGKQVKLLYLHFCHEMVNWAGNYSIPKRKQI